MFRDHGVYSCRATSGKEALVNTLLNNGMLLLVVGVMEGLFVMKVILNYVPTKPSPVGMSVVQRLKQPSYPTRNPAHDCSFDITRPFNGLFC